MFKRIMTYMLCFISAAVSSADSELDDRIVQLSRIEWNSVKSAIDTNGYCRVENHHVVIVITNGLPSIDVIHWLPIGRGPEKKKKYERRYELVPYVGQGGW